MKLLKINNKSTFELSYEEILDILNKSIKKCKLLFGYPDKKTNIYDWNYKVRVIKNTGEITKLGKYDNYGSIYVGKQDFVINHQEYKYDNLKKKTGKN